MQTGELQDFATVTDLSQKLKRIRKDFFFIKDGEIKIKDQTEARKNSLLTNEKYDF